ncbi:phosphatase PAP2-related protein [Tessaracoccus sp. Y36]
MSLGALAAVASWLANQVIVGSFADAPRPDDLLFGLLPYVRPARWLTVVALVAGPAVFLWAILRAAPSRLPEVLAAIALMYLLRAGMIVLTPLAPAQGEGVFVFPPQQYGMFPSGHTTLLALLALLVPEGPVWVRWFLWSMTAVMIAGLLLARGHYSIDVAGGLLLAYFVATACGPGRLFALFGRFTRRRTTPLP